MTYVANVKRFLTNRPTDDNEVRKIFLFVCGADCGTVNTFDNPGVPAIEIHI